MPVAYNIITTMLIITVMLVGCDKNSNTLASVTDGVSTKSALPQADIDPCEVALAPQSAGEKNLGGYDPNGDIARYQRAILQSKSPVLDLERLGWAFISRARNDFDPGFYNMAEQTALCMLSKHANRSEALLLRGHVLHSFHKFKQAEALALTLVNQRGIWFDYALLGDVLMEQGKLKRAINAYQLMLDQRPGPQAYSRVAHIRWIKGDVKGAIKMMRLMVNAQGLRDHESAAWAQTRLAQYLLQTNDLVNAKACIDRAIKWWPDYPPALLLRGIYQLAGGENKTAVKNLSRATQLITLPEYQWALIEALRMAGHFDTAAEVEAMMSTKGAVEDPRTVSLYLATSGKDVDLALQLAKRELKSRADVFTLDTVAWALKATGNIQEAREYSKRALIEGTLDARLLFHAGMIASAYGDKKSAADLLNKMAAIQHMLLPSERRLFLQEFVTLQSQIPAPLQNKSKVRDQSTI